MVVALVGPSGALAGNTGRSVAPTSIHAVQAAAEKTIASGSEILSSTGRIGALGQTFAVHGRGAMETKSSRASLALRFGTPSLATRVDVISAGTFVYLSSQLLTSALPVGKTWLGVDPTKLRLQGVFDAWVGSDGYIHRVRVTQSNPEIDVTLGFLRFGATPAPPLPPASQVYVSRSGTFPAGAPTA